MKLPRPQFGLKWIFAIVTSCALAIWFYWIGWPAWLDYRERVAFEHCARELRAGMTPREVQALFGAQYEFRWCRDAGGQEAAVMLVNLRTNSACVFLILDRTHEDALRASLEAAETGIVVADSNDIPSREVRVYRLKPAPYDYHARTELPRTLASLRAKRKQQEPPTERWRSEHEYMGDFIEWARGRGEGTVEIEYELIHSDSEPPSTEKESYPQISR